METQHIKEIIQEQSSGLPKTRRDLFLPGAMLFSAGVLVGPFAASCGRASERAQTESEGAAKAVGPGKSLYDRLGGIFAIAGVVNYFSDEIIKDPVAGARSKNPALRDWHTKHLDCAVANPDILLTEVHAHPVGRIGHRRPLSIHSHAAGQHQSRAGGSAQESPYLARGI